MENDQDKEKPINVVEEKSLKKNSKLTKNTILNIVIFSSIAVIISLLSTNLIIINRYSKKFQNIENEFVRIVNNNEELHKLFKNRIDLLINNTESQINLIEKNLSEQIFANSESFKTIEKKVDNFLLGKAIEINQINEKTSFLQKQTVDIENNILDVVKNFDTRIENIEKPISELEYLLEEEFNENITIETEKLHSSMSKTIEDTKANIYEAFNEIPEDIESIVYDLDGFYNRGKYNADECCKELKNSVQNTVNNKIFFALSNLKNYQIETVSNLKTKFFIGNISKDFDFVSEKFIIPDVKGITRLCSELNSNSYLKVIDEAITFIPFFGDAYDLKRSFIYDTRFEWLFRNDIQSSTRDLLSNINQKLFLNLKSYSPNKIEKICRDNFSVKRAVWSFFRGA